MPINYTNITKGLFEEDPTTQEYYLKYVNPESSKLFQEIESLKSELDPDDESLMDMKLKFNDIQNSLNSESTIFPEAKSLDGLDDRGLKSLDDSSEFATNGGLSKFSESGTQNKGNSGLNIDSLSKSIFGEKGVGVAENALGTLNGVIGAATTNVESEGAAIAQGASLGLKGAQLGTSIGGPLGGVIGGIGGAVYGLFDGQNDLKKLREEKKKKYRELLSQTKEDRKRDYLTSTGRYQ